MARQAKVYYVAALAITKESKTLDNDGAIWLVIIETRDLSSEARITALKAWEIAEEAKLLVNSLYPEADGGLCSTLSNTFANLKEETLAAVDKAQNDVESTLDNLQVAASEIINSTDGGESS